MPKKVEIDPIDELGTELTSPEDLPEGGVKVVVGQVASLNKEKGKFGHQLHIVVKTAQSKKSGKWEFWYRYGEAYDKALEEGRSARPDQRSQVGLFLTELFKLEGDHLVDDGSGKKKMDWSVMPGKWIVQKREKRDYGEFGVHNIWVPVYLSDKEPPDDIAKSGESAETFEDEATEVSWPMEHVRAALALMDGKTSKEFIKAVANVELDEGLSDAVRNGSFAALMIEHEFAKVGKAGKFEVVGTP